MKRLLILAPGAVFLPALAGGVLAAPGVHLMTAIQALAHAPGTFRYAVTVRPVGGVAHAVTLVLGTRRPAAWTAVAPGCLRSRDRTELACDLGDVRDAESRTLRFTGASGGGPAEAPVAVRASAANAPAVSSSLGTSTLRLTAGGRPILPRPRVARVGRTGADPDPSASAGVSPSGAPDASVQPSVAPSAAPAVQPSAAGSPGALPEDSPPAGAPSALPSGGEAPEVHSRASAPVGAPRKGGRARPRPSLPAPSVSAGAGAPGSPDSPGAPGASAAPGGASAVTHAPVAPDLPGLSAGVPPPPGAGGPGMPAPGASVPLPRIAPHPSRASPGEGTSELSTLSPASAMRAGRWSWATLIAVAIVSEAGLLWLVAGLSVWRRRGRPRPDGRNRRARSPKVLISRLLP